MLSKVLDVVASSFSFNHFEDVGTFFKEVINEFKQMNYSEFESDKFIQHEKALEELLKKQVN
jgi:V/A-type H+-transporting ATPase subunit A